MIRTPVEFVDEISSYGSWIALFVESDESFGRIVTDVDGGRGVSANVGPRLNVARIFECTYSEMVEEVYRG